MKAIRAVKRALVILTEADEGYEVPPLRKQRVTCPEGGAPSSGIRAKGYGIGRCQQGTPSVIR